MGEAKFGEIVYTYTNVKTGVTQNDKPLTAGTYIMTATVDGEGIFTNLESTYEFTIEEAFDSTFLLIDIILGLIACALAVVVIIFAVRRYKENG